MSVSFGAGNVPLFGSPVALAPSAARTTNGSGATVLTGLSTVARLTLNVTAVSGGTPNLATTVETSRDGTTWVSAGTFVAKTGTGTEAKSFGGLDAYVRVSWTITGTTPSFTFEVSGTLIP